jgi:hypothetical protein
MHDLMIGVFHWNPQIKGALYVIIALVVLPGSAYLLLSTNMGARVGALLAAAGFFGWMGTLGAVWWVYGTGPKGKEPVWKAQDVVVGDVATGAGTQALAGFPRGWHKVDATNPQVADASPVADTKTVGPKGQFKSSSDYVLVAAYEKGGKAHGPFNVLNLRPFNVFHTPHYLVIQEQRAIKGPVGTKPTADPQATPVAVVVVRDLGNVRLHPAVVSLSCFALFGVFCYMLHVRDKEAMAARAAATT